MNISVCICVSTADSVSTYHTIPLQTDDADQQAAAAADSDAPTNGRTSSTMLHVSETQEDQNPSYDVSITYSIVPANLSYVHYGTLSK